MASSIYEKLNQFDFNQVDAVFLDIDNTLYDYKTVHKKTISNLYSMYKNFYGEIGISSLQDFIAIYDQCRAEVRDEHKNTSMTRSRYLAFLKIFEKKSKIYNMYEQALNMEENYWQELVALISDADISIKKFLKNCNDLKTPVCVVTDMQTRFQIMKLNKLGVSNWINYLVSSEDVNCEKPDPKIFKYAISKVNAKPERIIMIGDDYKKDILGAKDLGMQVLHLGYHI